MLNDDVIDFGGIPLLAAADIMEMGGTEMGVAWGEKRDVWDEIGGKTTVWSEMRKKTNRSSGVIGRETESSTTLVNGCF